MGHLPPSKGYPIPRHSTWHVSRTPMHSHRVPTAYRLRGFRSSHQKPPLCSCLFASFLQWAKLFPMVMMGVVHSYQMPHHLVQHANLMGRWRRCATKWICLLRTPTQEKVQTPSSGIGVGAIIIIIIVIVVFFSCGPLVGPK